MPLLSNLARRVVDVSQRLGASLATDGGLRTAIQDALHALHHSPGKDGSTPGAPVACTAGGPGPRGLDSGLDAPAAETPGIAGGGSLRGGRQETDPGGFSVPGSDRRVQFSLTRRSALVEGIWQLPATERKAAAF